MKADKLIQNLKKVEPELTYPQVLTSEIMQSIDQKENSASLSSFNGILEIILSNKLRISAYMIIVGLIGLFSYQQLFILNKLNQMEQKIAVKDSESNEYKKAPNVINTKIIEQFALTAKEEKIVLNKKSLEDLLESYKDLRTDHEELLDLLNDNINNLEKKLSKKDIIKLKQLLKEEDLVKNLSINL